MHVREDDCSSGVVLFNVIFHTDQTSTTARYIDYLFKRVAFFKDVLVLNLGVKLDQGQFPWIEHIFDVLNLGVESQAIFVTD